MIRNPHTLEDSWWDGPERLQYVNRNVISITQNEDLFKFVKLFAPIKKGLHIGGKYNVDGTRVNWAAETKPLAILLNIKENCDVSANATSMPFDDNTFGYIVSFHTFEHIKGNPIETLREWLRVLIPGGILAITMPNKDYFLHDPNVIEDGLAAYHEMNPAQFRDLLKNFNDVVDVLLMDSRDNKFDFDILIRKR